MVLWSKGIYYTMSSQVAIDQNNLKNLKMGDPIQRIWKKYMSIPMRDPWDWYI